MEAKDTVMDYDGEEVGTILREFPSEVVSDALVDKLLQAQAEISFKVRIRKVVEFFREHCDDCNHIRPVYHFRVSGKEWQAKLKEWGVE